jgi:DNA-binding winged helix-turn-helix (wHTH) protein/Tol biopolymer transport system component
VRARERPLQAMSTTDHHVAVKVNPSAARLQFGDVTVVPGERLVLRKGQPVALTPKAFDLLLFLAENPGRLLTKEQMMQAVWADTAVEEANLAYHVFAIRKALGDTAEKGQLIETVPKSGYRFTGSVETIASSLGHLENGVTPEARPASRGVWRSPVWFVAGLLCAGGAAVLFNMSRTSMPPMLMRSQIDAVVPLSEASPFQLSPDGRQLVYAGKGPDGVTRLWVRRLDEEEPHSLAGTETALRALTPPMFWSPDSQSIAFDAAGQLKRFTLRDGATQTVCGLPGLAVGGSENTNGVVIVGQPNAGLYRCSDGRASELTRLDTAHGETAHVFPWFLPDGRRFLYVRVARLNPENSGVYLRSLDDALDAPRGERLLASGFGASYVPLPGTSTGHVIFLQNAVLYAQPFDERSMQLGGDAVAIASPVGSFFDGGFFSASNNDVIAYRPPDKDFQLTWFDREGNRTGTLGQVGRYSRIAISPDDSRVAVSKETVGSKIDQDIYVLDISRPASARKITSGSVLEEAPVWFGNNRLMFTTSGDVGTLFEQDVDGASAPRPLLGKTLVHKAPTSASRNGRFLLYTDANMTHSRLDVWALPLTGDGGEAFPLIQSDHDQDQARFSPDGRWVAYVSNDSGRNEVLVQRFVEPTAGPSQDAQITPVSNGGGSAPRWGRGGRELYFIAQDRRVMVVDFQDGARLTIGAARELLRLPSSHGDWDVLSDGSRFLIALPAGADASSPFTILVNHLRQLRADSR